MKTMCIASSVSVSVCCATMLTAFYTSGYSLITGVSAVAFVSSLSTALFIGGFINNK